MFEPTDAGVVALFARLRWKMLRGVLHSNGAQKWAVIMGMVASVLVGAVGAVMVFVAGRTSDDLDAVFVMVTTGSVLVVVMIGVIAGVTQPVDPRVLATEPMSERQLGVGLLAASAAGPPGLSALLFGIGLFAGAVGGASSVVPALVASAAVLATLLLVSRTTINALGLVATRSPTSRPGHRRRCPPWCSTPRSRSCREPSPAWMIRAAIDSRVVSCSRRWASSAGRWRRFATSP